ncbi:MAG TPA: 1-deoxy-D-xylulose-5-phosphate synthase N-terminal domain-containing protein [Solirubrobacterales bacterium]|jgi:transketolase|nr:1-deoxy-D-xylulose-5-phosphate synthase N-terminal domain-containing protein [Solirubrobacterales bacterium]
MDAGERARFAHAIRRTIVEQSYRANVGHIGSALSIADLVAVVVGKARLDGEADRDRIVLSKGHAALALYAALHLRGRLDSGMIDTYCNDGSLLGVHPEHDLDGIDFCTGSLGQGLSLGTGAALAAKRQGSARRVYVIMSDAELNEGSTWEAVMFAAQHRLDNLILLIDLNGQQALGYTHEVIDLGSVEDKLSSFGWSARAVPGHDQEALGDALERRVDEQPQAIVAQTTFGHGVSFMESEIKWHYLPLDEETYSTALAELDKRAAA